jgi:tetratricopeptide (TPR) repeat protein
MEAQALACWQKAIGAKADEPTWRFRYGKLLNINLRMPEAAEQLQKAIELAQSGEVSYAWLPEAHRLAAMSLGNNQAAVEHWQAFLRTGPADSPFRAEAMATLRRLGHPWDE